jgi:release factor glutamine methyltransferase
VNLLLREVGRATVRLAEAGVPSPRYDAEELAAAIHGVERGQLHRVPDGEFDARFWAAIARREAREPLQHITGKAHFRYLELAVGPGVFVPRPETEVVVGWAIDMLHARSLAAPVVVDLCTGSGAMALAVADEVPSAQVHAVELDETAFGWAMRNAAGTSVRLYQGDMADALPELDGSVDLVIANPPYIPMEAWESVAVEVRDHDPSLALWSGPDGLDAIRVVERAARRLLKPGGFAVVEHADVQGTGAPAVFRSAAGWTEIADHSDLAGRDRFVTARRSSSAGPTGDRDPGDHPRSEPTEPEPTEGIRP